MSDSDNTRETREFSVSLPLDKNGFLTRECPNDECKALFKIKSIGISDVLEIACPKCRVRHDINDFTTEDQVEYAISIASESVYEEMMAPLKEVLRDIEKSSRSMSGGLVSFKVTESRSGELDSKKYTDPEMKYYGKCMICSTEIQSNDINNNCPICDSEIKTEEIYE